METEILKQILNELTISNQKLTYLENDLKEFKSEMREFKSEMQEFKSEMQEFKSEMQEFKEKTENSLIRIENLHGQKIGVSLDGYTQLYELSNEIRRDIAFMKGRQDLFNFKLNNLEAEKKAN